MISYQAIQPRLRGEFDVTLADEIARNLYNSPDFASHYTRIGYLLSGNPFDDFKRVNNILGDMSFSPKIRLNPLLIKEIYGGRTTEQIATNSNWHMDGVNRTSPFRPGWHIAGNSFGGIQCLIGQVEFPLLARPFKHPYNQLGTYLSTKESNEDVQQAIDDALDSGDAHTFTIPPGFLGVISRGLIHRATPINSIPGPAPEFRLLCVAMPLKFPILEN